MLSTRACPLTKSFWPLLDGFICIGLVCVQCDQIEENFAIWENHFLLNITRYVHTATSCKNLIITLVKKNAIFRRQLAKIAEKRDHNIDPRTHWVGVNVSWWWKRDQCDRMNLWKNDPKCSPTDFLSKLMHYHNRGKSSPNVCYFCT
jgi:hypothetical protein